LPSNTAHSDPGPGTTSAASTLAGQTVFTGADLPLDGPREAAAAVFGWAAFPGEPLDPAAAGPNPPQRAYFCPRRAASARAFAQFCWPLAVAADERRIGPGCFADFGNVTGEPVLPVGGAAAFAGAAGGSAAAVITAVNSARSALNRHLPALSIAFLLPQWPAGVAGDIDKRCDVRSVGKSRLE